MLDARRTMKATLEGRPEQRSKGKREVSDESQLRDLDASTSIDCVHR
jgi:hypothetical protein